MKLAVITDPSGFGLVQNYRLGYHLVLAQQVLADPEYARFYRICHDQGQFIILDNGAAEEGALTASQIVLAANMVCADEVAMLDVLEDADMTISKARELTKIIPDKNRMIIPQGRSIPEWKANLQVLCKMGFRSIGIPKHLENKEGGRKEVLEWLKGPYCPEVITKCFDIHLLGVWGLPSEEVELYSKQFPWIRGIDTAAPFAYAQHDEHVFDGGIVHRSHVWGKLYSVPHASRSIACMLDWANGKESQYACYH